MDIEKRNILNKHKELIIQDLHGDVIEDLRRKLVLSDSEYDTINNLESQELRNEKLLETLVFKDDGYEELAESLKEWYGWIEEKLRPKQNLTRVQSNSWKDLLVECNIQAVPVINVTRNALLDEVRVELKKLQRNHYVVLYGMSGCGKSSLAAEALHSDLLTGVFQGKVYWLSCGRGKDIEGENDILALQNELYTALCNEDEVVNNEDTKVNTFTIKLKKRLKTSKFENGLIILDDVNNAEVIEAFNIGCKIMVTTNDRAIMDSVQSRCKHIKVDEGFTKQESLNYLSKCVGMPVDKLPEQAYKIHKHGKGHPLLLSLIGSQLLSHQEEARSNSDSWRPYVDVLRNKEYGHFETTSSNRQSFGRSNLFSQTIQTIELCKKNLSPDMQERYKDFALFSEDVNIHIEVLEVLWNMGAADVKLIMDEYVKKSLIVRKFVKSAQTYVYGIHDILLFDLKKKLNEDNKEALKDLHIKIIDCYKKRKCPNENLAKLQVDDNYFIFYIGYHIANAKLYHLFPELYFNLEFIHTKLTKAGPGDLILDYKRYCSHFVETNCDQGAMTNKIQDFVHFVEVAGQDVRRGVNITQLGLQEPHDSEVYRAAVSLANTHPHHPYLCFQLGPSKKRSAPVTIQRTIKVSSACFSNNDKDVIVGYETGLIEIISQNNHVNEEYEGHKNPVFRLQVRPRNQWFFLSVSCDCVKIWKMPELGSSIGKGGGGSRTPSPSERQWNFESVFSSNSREKKPCELSYPSDNGIISWACFSTNGDLIAVCFPKSWKVKVWGVNRNKTLISKFTARATSCIFAHSDRLLIVGCFDGKIVIQNLENDTCTQTMAEKSPILTLFSLPMKDNKETFGALNSGELCIWTASYSGADDKPKKALCFKDYQPNYENEMYKCCAASPDGSVVAVATTSGRVLICCPNEGYLLREMNNSNGNIGYLAMDHSREHILLACHEDCTIKLWSLSGVSLVKSTIMRPRFDVAWMPNNRPVIVAPTYSKPCVKKISEIRKHEGLNVSEISKSEDIQVAADGEVNICSISKCGKYVVVSNSVELRSDIYLHCNVEETNTLLLKIHTVKASPTRIKCQVVDGQLYVVMSQYSSLLVWSCGEEHLSESNKYVYFTITLSGQIVNYFFHSVKKEVITVTIFGSIKRWSLVDGSQHGEVWPARWNSGMTAADLSCDNVLATTDDDKLQLCLYDVNTNNTLLWNPIKLCGRSTCCSFSIDGRKLAVGLQNGIQVLDIPGVPCNNDALVDLHFSVPYKEVDHPVRTICVSRTGVVGLATSAWVLLFSPSLAEGKAKLSVKHLVMSPEDDSVITVADDGNLQIIDFFRPF